MHVLLALNAENVADSEVLKQAAYCQRKKNAQISVVYVIPEVNFSQYINLSFISDGVIDAISSKEENRTEGQNALRNVSQLLSIPLQQQYLVDGS